MRNFEQVGQKQQERMMADQKKKEQDLMEAHLQELNWQK